MTAYQLRLLIPRPLKNLLRDLSYVSIFSDMKSLLRYLRISRQADRHKDAAEMVDLKIRRLQNRAITIRTRGTDARVVFATFMHRFHLPPRNTIFSKAPLILDLGANIGCTIADLACNYPQATIVGVELDSENASLCRQNISAWSDRCRVIEGAVWAEDGRVEYEHREGCEDGFAASAHVTGSNGQIRSVSALSINTLVGEICDSTGTIDYIKMDIEGAERDVLRANTEWAKRVRCIKVELHGGYTKQECISDLKRLGFNAYTDNQHALCVIGVSDSN